VRRFLPSVVDFLVAGLAGLRSQILGGFGGRHAGGWSARVGNRRGSLAGSKGDDKERQNREGKKSRCPGICQHQYVPENRGVGIPDVTSSIGRTHSMTCRRTINAIKTLSSATVQNCTLLGFERNSTADHSDSRGKPIVCRRAGQFCDADHITDRSDR
jgi:hypothetical protein